MHRVRSMVTVIATAIFAAAAASDPAPGGTLPALSREWHSAEYQAVAKAIDTGAIALPMFSDRQGQALLRKITSIESLALEQDKRLPVETRISENLSLIAALRQIINPYVAKAAKGERVSAETAAILAFLLRAAGTGRQLLDEYLPTIPHDARYASRMDGLKTIQTGHTNMLFGLASSITERAFYSDDDVSVMLSALADTIHTLKASLAGDSRGELVRKLDGERKHIARPGDLRNLDRVLSELRS